LTFSTNEKHNYELVVHLMFIYLFIYLTGTVYIN